MRTLERRVVLGIGVLGVCIVSGCIHVPTPEEQLAHVAAATGLRPDREGADPSALTKVHRGYPVLVRFSMGDVWGRYGARLAAGELGRETQGVLGFLTGQTRSGVGTIVGSPFDRALSATIGQPLSVVAVLRHEKGHVSRLDILNSSSTIRPEDPLPAVESISMSAGTLYTADSALAHRILSNKSLIDVISRYRSQYVRVDDNAVSFLFAGSENEYSGMLRNFGGYDQMILGILDGLAGIADEL